jgi:acetamidase/formamidase
MNNVLWDLPEFEFLTDLHSAQGGGEVAALSVQVVQDRMEKVRVSEENAKNNHLVK